MASRTTTKNLGVLIKGIGETAQKAQKDAVYNASRYTINTIESRMYKDLGGRNFFRNMRFSKGRNDRIINEKKVTTLYLRFNVKGTINPTSLITAHGPWGLLEYGADPHTIKPRLNIRQRQKGMTKAQKRRDNANIAFGGRGALKGTRPLGDRRTGFGPVYRANHPGVRPKKTFSKGLEQATPMAEKIAFSLIQTPIIRFTRTQLGTYLQVTGESDLFKPGRL